MSALLGRPARVCSLPRNLGPPFCREAFCARLAAFEPALAAKGLRVHPKLGLRGWSIVVGTGLVGLDARDPGGKAVDVTCSYA
jgi:hypothetical protein